MKNLSAADTKKLKAVLSALLKVPPMPKPQKKAKTLKRTPKKSS